jgi:hypothetical protein
MAKATKQEIAYVEYLRTGIDIRYLAQKYRKAHEWIPRLASEAPGLTPEEALKKVRESLKKLRSSRKRLKKKRLAVHIDRAGKVPNLRRSISVRAIPPKERFFVSSAGSPGSIELAYPRPIDLSDIYPNTVESARQKILERIGTINNRVDGIARASGFKEYIWAAPDNNDTDESHLFLPYGAGSDPYNFNGATGLQFLSEIDVQPNLFWDDSDSCGFAGILQYSLPEAPWDGAVQWCVHQHFEIPEIVCSADYGYFSLVSTARQSPTGEDFPDSNSFVTAFSIDQLLPIIGASGEEFSAGPFNVTDIFHSGFPVTKGQKPRIYVGFSVLIWARDGSTALGDPNMAYHTCPGAGSGLSYTFHRI